MLSNGLKVRAGAINLKEDYQNELYPFMISDGKRLVDIRALEYYANLW